MNKHYFNTDENAEHIDTYGTLRILPQGDGFQVVQGGYRSNKDKLISFAVVAYCETEEEAQTLIKKLCEIASPTH